MVLYCSQFLFGISVSGFQCYLDLLIGVETYCLLIF